MPTRPLPSCLEPFCAHRAVADGHGRCALHARLRRERWLAEHPDTRESASRRGYDATWSAVRSEFIKSNPWCAFCALLGRRVAATDVDHVVALVDGGSRLDPQNLQSLCHTHHSQKTARANGLGASQRQPSRKG